ncbi:MAG TPA: helix-turn-helix domain-containing protein [Burkholderiaceae bacterium]
MATDFSTEAVALPNRLDYWRETVCATFAEIECESLSNSPFRARLSDVELAGIHFCEASASPVNVLKTEALIRRASHNNFMMCIQQSGSCVVEQNGRQAHLMPGDLALLDSMRPYRVHFPVPFKQLVVHMPRDELLAVSNHAEAQCGRRVPGARGSSALVAQFMHEMSSHLRAPDAAPSRGSVDLRFKEAALALIGAALAAEPEAVAKPHDRFALLYRARDLMAREAADPQLTVESIARELFVSERRLQQVFQQHGESASHHLWRLRLERCKAALDKPEWASRGIGEIALMSGFNSFSHFSRSFKNAYGCTPREYRSRSN